MGKWSTILVIAALLLPIGCSTTPLSSQKVNPSATSETSARPDAGDTNTGDRSGSSPEGRAGRDLTQKITDLSTQVTSLQKTVTQVTKVTSSLEQETTAIKQQMGSLGQVSERIDEIGSLVQKTRSTVHGISEERLSLETKRTDRLWRYAEILAAAFLGLVLIALAAPGPTGWKAKMVFYSIGATFMVSAVALFFT